MKDTHKRRARIITACFAVTMIGAVMLLVGCGRYQPGTEKSWTVGDCELHEEIQRSKNDWPDACFLRTYRLKRDGRELTVGSYENESSTGVINSPFEVGEYIVIPTSCYVYRVGADNRVNEFYPWKADQWLRFSEPLGIDGHYDYYADKVEKVDGVWRLIYALDRGLNGRRPKIIHFVTTDDWRSFQIEDGGRNRQPVANDFRDEPLVVGGGTNNIVQANPEYVAQNDPPRRAAHFDFVVDPSLKARVTSSSSGNVPDKFVWQARRKYRIGGKTLALDYSLDGRKYTLNAGGKTFELVKGNYFRFHILPGPSLFVDQLPVVDTIGDAASEDVQSQVRAVFDAHPSRTEIPKASRRAIPEAKADSLSPAERNLKKLSEQLPN